MPLSPISGRGKAGDSSQSAGQQIAMGALRLTNRG